MMDVNVDLTNLTTTVSDKIESMTAAVQQTNSILSQLRAALTVQTSRLAAGQDGTMATVSNIQTQLSATTASARARLQQQKNIINSLNTILTGEGRPVSYVLDEGYYGGGGE